MIRFVLPVTIPAALLVGALAARKASAAELAELRKLLEAYEEDKR